MVLSLITPVGSDFIKNFPSQNAVNCDTIDAYAAPCLTSHALQSWTPQLTAVTTNPTLGTGGFIRGFYYEIFDQIYAWGEFRFGSSGASGGTGLWMISLPFEAKTVDVDPSDTLGGAALVGSGLIWDDSNSSARMPITSHLKTSTLLHFGFKMDSSAGSRSVGSAQPITWAALDGLTFFARYQRLP